MTQPTEFTPITEARALAREMEAVSMRIDSRNRDIAIGTTFEGVSVMLPISEDYQHRPAQEGSRIIALVVDATPGATVVSRTHPRLPDQIVEGVVPEVSEGRVRIMGVARDAGHRVKIAVAATEEDLDPISACVGRGGKRAQRISEMLGGERVEIIAWHPKREDYLAAALAPGKVHRVKINKEGEATAWTAPHLIAATVGEQGQNSLLAGRLVGVRVHVEVEDPDLPTKA